MNSIDSKIIIILVFIILLFCFLQKKYENFGLDTDNIKNGLKLNIGNIDNLNNLKIRKIPNSEKIAILNMIKTHPVENLLFSKNLELINNLLKYKKKSNENIINLTTGFTLLNQFESNKENNLYGIQIKYHSENKNNYGSIGIEFNSYMDLHITKLLEMNKMFNDKSYEDLIRKKVEVISNETEKKDFLPYFKSNEIESLVLFKNKKNKEYIIDLEGYFNIVDRNFNRILTKCKLDTPFCKLNLPQKDKIYGRDKFVASRFKPLLDSFEVISKKGITENKDEITNFQDSDNKLNLDLKYEKYLQYYTKKECINDKKNATRISIKQFLKDPILKQFGDIKDLEHLRKLKGLKCIKHYENSRDSYYYGGFNKDNKMFCYGKDDECILFSNKKDCKKLNLEKLLSVSENDRIKGIKYNNKNNKKIYTDKSLKNLQKSLSAEMKKNKDISLICPDGEYLEGTFNPEDEIFIQGGIFKDCKDKFHPNHEKCSNNSSPSSSPNEYYLSGLITNQGNKIYNPNKENKYYKFGELNGKCIKENIPEGRMQECDPLDDIQACYVGTRDSLVPGESIGNEDIYKRYINFNCNTFKLDTNTCKHNNNGFLSDVISFSSPIENNYLDIINNQKILKIVNSNIPQIKREEDNENEMVYISEEEKYENKNLHLYIEKYFEIYEDMNPKKYFDKLRYTLRFNPIIDYITKEKVTTINIYYKGKLEETLKEGYGDNKGEILQVENSNIIEILLKKNNHLEFIVKEKFDSTNYKSSYTTKNKLEGSEFGEPINCFISQNNNTFLKNIKYKEKIPSLVLPYNPFINVEMNSPTPSKDN